METMKEIFEAEQQMIALKEVGKIEESALLGFEMLKAMTHLPMIERESYQYCFNKITQEQFFQHVIQTASKMLNPYRS